MIYPQMTTGRVYDSYALRRAYEYDVYEKFRDDLFDIIKVFPDVLISHHALNCSDIYYNNILYLIEMKFFNIGEKPWYEINAYKPLKISADFDSLRRHYWYKVSESNDVDNDYKIHPIVINKKRFWSVDRAHYKTLNSFDEIKDDVQIWMTEINKKLLKARIEAI